MSQRYIGLDIGAETIKAVEVRREAGRLLWTRRRLVEHHKQPGPVLKEILSDWNWAQVHGAAVTGRLSRLLALARIPTKQALARGFRELFPDTDATLVSIGSHGFAVLELRDSGTEVLRENSRCSQGTGNFLRQLIERFDLGLEEASELCAEVEKPAPLSGRCPVILKTDMTHLANKGEERTRILAGLFDAVCENVQVLVKPRLCPKRLVLTGGVTRSRRIRDNFRRFASRHDLDVVETRNDDALFFEALGCAALAVERPVALPTLDDLLAAQTQAELERVPGLRSYLPRVKRLKSPDRFPPPLRPPAANGPDLIVGLDMGSTGSKAVAIDVQTGQAIWESYLKTNGDPVGAAQALVGRYETELASRARLCTFGVTGSGREIVGSLLATCYGAERVFVLNEIAAHAEGALSFDPRVDTIFEIGGQDAKYIRLDQGRVIDAAMNEACSAGTGSFIEEQGNKLAGFTDVAALGQEALAAQCGISLGQHCSVFMAEVIDDAVALGADERSIIAGLYDSIVQNYLNRVKGNRTVGKVIFCQGMPFSADALAAAVARRTGSDVVIPPNPGTVGALGIALLARKRLGTEHVSELSPARFLAAQLEKKDTFVCQATRGCGAPGNKCRIDRITTVVSGTRERFTWGGGCSLYDQAVRGRKLPDLAPDPFREREELTRELVESLSQSRGLPSVAMTDEFALKSLFPFFATFVHELGFDLHLARGADQRALKRGIEEANIPFCAPMQQYHGLVAAMAEARPDYVLAPMMREVTRVASEKHACLCPIVQASPDLLRWDLGCPDQPKLISPIIDMGTGNLESAEFVASCRRLASDLGASTQKVDEAYRAALAAQVRFDQACLEIGERALSFCREHDVVCVVVLGRAYTIYNTVLNSNVPALLREQGAIALPVDCYPVAEDVPIYGGMFWSYGQRNLRAAHQIRRGQGTYALYCSNYSCGPDSFTLHFFSYLMEGKPFAVIETDGHSGDAGTKTRIEAFLHCVREDRGRSPSHRPTCLRRVEERGASDGSPYRRDETLLIPRMGPGAQALAAALRGIGIAAEALPVPTRETLAIGRRHTSGKECLPMCITLGSLLQKVEAEPGRKFSFLMPTAYGPCRFGAYQLLHKVLLERLGHSERVRVISPDFRSYYAGVPGGFSALVFTALLASDLLLEALYDARPGEREPGAANAVFARYQAELLALLERAGAGELSVRAVLIEVARGRLFGCLDLLTRAAREFAALKTETRRPTVLVVGEIYARCDSFANDDVVDKLEARGLRVRFAPMTEWLEYSDYINAKNGDRAGLGDHVSSLVRSVICALAYSRVATELGWPRRTTVRDALAAAAPYVREDLQGEAVLTLGAPLSAFRQGHIDGAVSVGPLECLPNKIAEAQFFHVAEREGLPSLTLASTGEPLPPDALDNFAFAVHARAARADTKRPEARTSLPQPLSILGDFGMDVTRSMLRQAVQAWPAAARPIELLRRLRSASQWR